MSLERILDAKSVAIVGASKNVTKRGYQAVRTLLDEKYEGAIYPVNPKEKAVLGLKCYPKVAAISEPVDLALIATPAKTVPMVLEDCGAKGVAGAVVLAGGFSEAGLEGKALEQEMVAVAQKHNIRIIGPNTSGALNFKSHMNLVGIKNAPGGDIALLTQSGNMALTLITEASVKSNKGFTYYVGVGNEADLNFHEYLDYFRQDPDTKAILMYVEGLRKGRAFLQSAHLTTAKKPVILFKSGRSSTGKRSAGSHTGALAGDAKVAKSVFEQAGITVIENSDELFPAAEALSCLPPIPNNRIAILADGGGHATIAADKLSDLGLELPELAEKTQGMLREILSAAASVPNPVDVAGGTDSDPLVFAKCAEIMLADPNVGGLLIVGLFGGYGIRFAEELTVIEEDAAHQMGKMVQITQKPIVLHSLFTSLSPHPVELMRYYGIPIFDSLDIACSCIDVLSRYGNHLAKQAAIPAFALDWGKGAVDKAQQMIVAAGKEDRSVLLEPESKKLLQWHGAATFEDVLVTSADEAAKVVADFDRPVAMKIVSPDILHKSDAGGVMLNIKTAEAAEKAHHRIMAAAKEYKVDADIRGILISPMAESGVEVIIGTKMDDQFGPVIMFGVGGVFVEVFKDVVFQLLPLTAESAAQMIGSIQSASILNGLRGNPPADKAALVQLLLKVSEIIEAYPGIIEMDLNPVIVHATGVSVVDARVILGD